MTTIWTQAERVTPGGVHSFSRRIDPLLSVTRTEGARMYEADGRSWSDYHAAFGALVLGHRHPDVDAAVVKALGRLDLTGVGVTDLEVEAASRIVEHVPAAEQVLFCNSGSEATYSAIRLARAVTGRRTLVKFQGCYHGWHDAVALNVITAKERMGAPDPLSAGSSPGELGDTVVCRFNDLDSVREAFAAHDVAAVIVEPIPHNVGALMPQPGFLAGLREITQKAGAVLIFDEVITGFRHGLGGYQGVAGVTPDLTTLGKAMANGYPAAAVAGSAALLGEYGTAGGPVYWAGTYNAHPAAVAATTATIDVLATPGVYDHIFELGERARTGLEEAARRHGFTAYASGYGSVFVLYFTSRFPVDYEDLLENDAAAFVGLHRGLVERGHYLYPSNLKRNHVSSAHTAADIDRLLEDADHVLAELAAQR
ncbi:aspartate aminotransferase family protein [Rhizohabitans arisaemae]|uniref:aspartate aminotransferase family protein n=1 Tax=Rhizohabitans arisaemae TaxID=2720610 RepID=UPI0024B1DE32|nr:aspartate aminotransferase family protein [Rhizohabitans arisaemae]